MLSPYGRDERAVSAEPETKQEGGEDPRLKRLEAQIETLTQQLEALGRGRQDH
jgi:hypothetical protein